MSPSRSHRNCLEIEQIGDVNVAKFTTQRILSEGKMYRVCQELDGLGREAGHQQVILNFDGVRRLSSEVVGKLMALRHTFENRGGQLAVCNVHPSLLEIFDVCKLPEVMTFYSSEQEALQ